MAERVMVRPAGWEQLVRDIERLIEKEEDVEGIPPARTESP